MEPILAQIRQHTQRLNPPARRRRLHDRSSCRDRPGEPGCAARPRRRLRLSHPALGTPRRRENRLRRLL